MLAADGGCNTTTCQFVRLLTACVLVFFNVCCICPGLKGEKWKEENRSHHVDLTAVADVVIRARVSLFIWIACVFVCTVCGAAGMASMPAWKASREIRVRDTLVPVVFSRGQQHNDGTENGYLLFSMLIPIVRMTW